MFNLHISLSDGSPSESEMDILNKYANLCIEIASARCWSQCQYTVCLPNAFAITHHEDHQERQRGILYVKKIWDKVLKAEQALGDPTLDAEVRQTLQQVMKDLAWNRGQVARELYLVCAAGGWDATDEETRKLGFYLFSNPANTKQFLEDCFAHLADVIKRIARQIKLSKWSKFFYMTSVPQQHDLKWPRLEPTPHDFAEAMKLGGRSRLAEDTKKGSVFTVSSKFVLPKSLKFTVANLKQIDRSAGTAANQRAAAATAWILANAGNDFAHAPMTWTGVFLLKRRIYINNQGKAYMCLGFQTYAALGFPLETCSVDGKDYVFASEGGASAGFSWMMNNELILEGPSKWKMLPTRLLLSPQLPPCLRAHGSVWEPTGQPQPILTAAVKAGVSLTVHYLEMIHRALRFPLPQGARKWKIRFSNQSGSSKSTCRAFMAQ